MASGSAQAPLSLAEPLQLCLLRLASRGSRPHSAERHIRQLGSRATLSYIGPLFTHRPRPSCRPGTRHRDTCTRDNFSIGTQGNGAAASSYRAGDFTPCESDASGACQSWRADTAMHTREPARRATGARARGPAATKEAVRLIIVGGFGGCGGAGSGPGAGQGPAFTQPYPNPIPTLSLGSPVFPKTHRLGFLFQLCTRDSLHTARSSASGRAP